jgi:hypothetical protein
MYIIVLFGEELFGEELTKGELLMERIVGEELSAKLHGPLSFV